MLQLLPKSQKIDSLRDILKQFIAISKLNFIIKIQYTDHRPSFHVYGDILQCFHKLFTKDDTDGSLHYQNIEGVPDDCDITLIEFSIKTRKWLCIGLYKPPSQNDKYFLDNLSLILNKLTCQFDNFILMGDFNLYVEDKNLKAFMSTFDMECLINPF